ncbi:TIGR04282 family arsenosugar biosynthesis glycosyltransferase [Stratiformator vulcanicus]|uniref:2-phospho-L-lactate guanylyltransferase n=1 Tax=Stratiformator vulcanicus TaxID=2527980 RepID=A0A517R5S1_9PLAN|nr:DUF2064 domain-containing protein [Stratiformator vulcanicus]QDT39244.1 hypothetical protein Pan189_36480 [Stratiformator vulcanicus]
MENDGCIVAFVKSPEYSPVKTRLASTIGDAAARRFYEGAVSATEALLVESARRFAISPLWAVAEEDALDEPRWLNLARVPQGDGPLGERLDRVYRDVRRRHRFAIFIGADAPHLSLSVIEETVTAMQDTGSAFVIAPADDGGYVLFAGRDPLPNAAWTNVPYSDEATARRFTQELRQHGTVSQLPTQFDVDDVESLKRLAELDPTSLLPAQREAIRAAKTYIP